MEVLNVRRAGARPEVRGMNLDEWGQQYSKVSRWLRLRRRSKGPLLSIIRGFVNWLHENGPEELRDLNPDGLVKFQEEASTNGDKKLISESMIDYLLSDKRWRQGYKTKIRTTIRSFFKSNGAALPDTLIDDELLALWNEETPEAAPGELTLENLKRVIDSSNLMYKAIFKAMFSTGMGIGELIHWSNQGIGALRNALEDPNYKPHGLIRIDCPARKKTGRRGRSLPYHVLLGGDTLDTLKRYLKMREKRHADFVKNRPGEVFPDAIFISNIYTALTINGIQNYWMRRLARQGIVVKAEDGWSGKRYGKNIHQIRAIFRNQAPLARREGFDQNIAEFFMGHTSKLDSNTYLDFHKRRPNYVREEYLKLLPFVDIENDRVWHRVPDEAYHKQEEKIQKLEGQITELKTMVVKETIPSQAQMIEDLKEHQKLALDNIRKNLALLESDIVMAENKGDAESVARLKTAYENLRAVFESTRSG